MTMQSLATNNNAPRTNSKSTIVCHNCGKTGHIVKKCWVKGGGMEGQGPKQGQGTKLKTGTNVSVANANNTDVSSPMETYVMAAQAKTRSSTSEPAQRTPLNADTATRQDNSILREKCQQETAGKDVGGIVDRYSQVPKSDCTACKGNTPLYAPPVPIIYTFLNSGASEHCWVQQSDFTEYTKVQGQGGSSAISGEAGRFQIVGTGTVKFVTRVGEKESTIQLRGVKHTPEFGHNLILVPTLDSWGMRGDWGHGMMIISAPNGKVVMKGFGKNKMYEVEVLESGKTTVNYSRARDRPADIHTWH